MQKFETKESFDRSYAFLQLIPSRTIKICAGFCLTMTLLPDPCNGGSLCVFPFTFKGAIHKKCTDAESDQMWCSTGTDANGDYIEGQWALCENCTSGKHQGR